MALNVREKAFAEEYIKNCGNAYQAAIAAGYSEPTAKNAAKWLDEKNVEKRGENSGYKPELAAYIKEELAKMKSARIADATEVLEYLTAVQRGEVYDVTMKYVGGGKQVPIEVPASVRDRNKAAELLGKVHGIFTERMEVSGVGTVTIVNDLED